MSRNIIIVDQSQIMRRILRGIVQANLNDVRVFEAKDDFDAEDILTKNKCHLVLYSWDMTSNFENFLKDLNLRPADQQIPFLLLLSSDQLQYSDKAVAFGVEKENIISSDGESIIYAINKTCNPLAMRLSKRYSIPNTRAKLQQGDFVFHASVTNISSGGMLCDLEFSRDFKWALPCLTTIAFQHDDTVLEATEIESMVRRINVTEVNPDNSPCLLRIGLRFISNPNSNRNIFEKVFEKAEKEEQMLQKAE